MCLNSLSNLHAILKSYIHIVLSLGDVDYELDDFSDVCFDVQGYEFHCNKVRAIVSAVEMLLLAWCYDSVSLKSFKAVPGSNLKRSLTAG